MWYRLARENERTGFVRRRMMRRMAASTGRLWKLLDSTGIAQDIGVNDLGDFNNFLEETGPEGVNQIGESVEEIPDEEVKQEIQEAFSGYMAGKILGEEIRRAEELAMSEGRQPSVSDLRDARRRANERLMEEASSRGLGLPRQFQLGSRGPLTREPRLRPLPERSQELEDERLRGLVEGIWAIEMSRAQDEAQRRFDEGQSESWEPNAADMRAAVERTNEQLAQSGFPFIKLKVGSRGPFPSGGPAFMEIVREPDQFWAKERHRRRNEGEAREKEEAEQKRENLGLEPALKIDEDTPVVLPDPIPDLSDNQLPEETIIEQQQAEEFPENARRKSLQMNYHPRPPLHDHCRCRIEDLMGRQIWKTAGDDRVCPECEYHSNVFNSLGGE